MLEVLFLIGEERLRLNSAHCQQKDKPTLPLETFDVSASDYDDLVEKLT